MAFLRCASYQTASTCASSLSLSPTGMYAACLFVKALYPQVHFVSLFCGGPYHSPQLHVHESFSLRLACSTNMSLALPVCPPNRFLVAQFASLCFLTCSLFASTRFASIIPLKKEVLLRPWLGTLGGWWVAAFLALRVRENSKNQFEDE